MPELYIGLLSGTSADGIDAALVDFSQNRPRTMATHYAPYSPTLREKIFALYEEGKNEIQRMGELDVILGKAFAQAAIALLRQQTVAPQMITAIGSHGQTIRHFPHGPYRFTVQIGDPNTIAAETGITTVADFRRKDIALGGQGAPLVPAFHQQVLTSDVIDRAIVNIGGIANITLLPRNQSGPIIGFDTGPGNALMDMWIYVNEQKQFDQYGDWGSQGVVHAQLLEFLLADAYFSLPPPKSTGREYFNFPWLSSYLKKLAKAIQPIDIQATLAELTASTILSAIRGYIHEGEILVCGGGAHNALLMRRLRELAHPNFCVETTQKLGVEPDWVEAMAFAWLARQTLNRRPGNFPSITGAKHAVVLGGVYYG